MPEKESIIEKLKKIDAEVGDTITVTKDGDKQEGVLMPHHQFSNDDIVTIKLKYGYNIEIKIESNTKISLVKKHKETMKKTREIPYDPKKPTVSVIGTGGTIACYVDYRTGAVNPATSAQELAFSVPEIFEVCNVYDVKRD